MTHIAESIGTASPTAASALAFVRSSARTAPVLLGQLAMRAQYTAYTTGDARRKRTSAVSTPAWEGRCARQSALERIRSDLDTEQQGPTQDTSAVLLRGDYQAHNTALLS